MINTSNTSVIVHIPMEPAVVRFNGGDVKCLRPAQGFAWAEYADGNVFPISHPLEEWIYDVTGNDGPTPGTAEQATLYFVIDPPGKAGNPGQDDEQRSLTDIQTVL